MSASQLFRIFLSFVLALFITVTAYYFNTQRAIQEHTAFALQLARQTAMQVETLETKARERQESRPLDWAIQNLAVGPEQRPIQMAPFKLEPQQQHEHEKYNLNPKNGIFSYYQILHPESGEGIRLHIQVGYIGLFGAESPFQNDSFLLTLFILIISLSSHFMRFSGSSGSTQKAQPSNQIPQWATDAQSVLMQLGIHMRDLTKQAHTLTAAAAKSKEQLELHTHQLPETALQSYAPVFQSSQDLNRAISLAKDTLLTLAKMLQSLKAGDFMSQSPSASHPAEK
jgi:hypothetical protein